MCLSTGPMTALAGGRDKVFWMGPPLNTCTVSMNLLRTHPQHSLSQSPGQLTHLSRPVISPAWLSCIWLTNQANISVPPSWSPSWDLECVFTVPTTRYLGDFTVFRNNRVSHFGNVVFHNPSVPYLKYLVLRLGTRLSSHLRVFEYRE